MSLSAVIIDDEEDAQKALSSLLKTNHSDLRLLGSADGVSSGLDLISRVAPDIMFLDVELGTTTGFELLEALGEKRPYLHHSPCGLRREGHTLQCLGFPIEADRPCRACYGDPQGHGFCTG